MVPTLLGQSDQQEHEYLYWEFPEYGGQQAVRLRDWKGIRRDMQEGSLTVELYNLATDPREQTDVADQHPDIVARIEAIMLEEHEPPANELFEIEALAASNSDTR